MASVEFEFDTPEEAIEKIEPAIRAGIRAYATVVADKAVRSIKSRRGAGPDGVRVRKGRGGGRVSLPGESPTTQTGQLRNRIFYTEPNERIQSFVGTDVEYGRFLEFGTSKMEPRPWLRRSAKSARRTGMRKAIEAIRMAMPGALE